MAEYIKREDAIQAAKHAWAKGLEPSQYIECIPTADVAEVRHGKLNFLQEDMVLCYCGVCSVCRNYVQAWNYCPNCGARMDKEN